MPNIKIATLVMIGLIFGQSAFGQSLPFIPDPNKPVPPTPFSEPTWIFPSAWIPAPPSFMGFGGWGVLDFAGVPLLSTDLKKDEACDVAANALGSNTIPDSVKRNVMDEFQDSQNRMCEILGKAKPTTEYSFQVGEFHCTATYWWEGTPKKTWPTDPSKIDPEEFREWCKAQSFSETQPEGAAPPETSRRLRILFDPASDADKMCDFQQKGRLSCYGVPERGYGVRPYEF